MRNLIIVAVLLLCNFASLSAQPQPVFNRAPLADVPYESSFAGYKDWFIQKFRRPGYTIEAGSGQNPLPIGQFDEIYRNNLPILVTAAMGLGG